MVRLAGASTKVPVWNISDSNVATRALLEDGEKRPAFSASQIDENGSALEDADWLPLRSAFVEDRRTFNIRIEF